MNQKTLNNINETVNEIIYRVDVCMPNPEDRAVLKSWMRTLIQEEIEKSERILIGNFIGEYLTGKLSMEDWKIVLEQYQKYLSQPKGDKE